MGKTWWERSLILMEETPKVMRDSILDTWDAFIHARTRGRHDLLPPEQDRDRGMDMGR
jgi:hypothetical protein